MLKGFMHVIDFVITTDRPVVYKDDSGEMVTDLAYQTDFTDMAPTQHAKLQEQFAKGSLDFDVTMADDFKPAGTIDSHMILCIYLKHDCTCLKSFLTIFNQIIDFLRGTQIYVYDQWKEDHYCLHSIMYRGENEEKKPF